MRKTEIRMEPIEAFFERARETAELADRGERIPPRRVVAFEDVSDLLGILTVKRVELLKAVKETPGSIAELARNPGCASAGAVWNRPSQRKAVAWAWAAKMGKNLLDKSQLGR